MGSLGSTLPPPPFLSFQMRRASMAALRPRRGRRRSEQRLTQKLLTAAEEGDSVRVATCLQNGANINSSGVHGR